MSYGTDFLKSFFQNNWLVLLLLVGVYFFWQHYESLIGDVATLKTTTKQLVKTIEDIEEENAALRQDITLRTTIGIEHREKEDVLENTARQAGQVLEKGSTTSSWGSDPYPDYVYDAVRMLEQEPGNSSKNED